MSIIEVEPGVGLEVQDLGEGRPIVLIAGFGLCHEVWDGQVRELSATNRVVCIDLRGTGGSDKPLDGYSIPRLAADVGAVLETLNLRDVTLVGWSFGGQISLALAASEPDRLAQLVLVCSNAVRASRSAEFPFGAPEDRLLETLVRGEREDRIASRHRTIASGFHGDADPRVVDYLVGLQLRMPSWAAVACYRSYLQTDLVSELPRVTLPVLQIIGADDVVTPVAGAAWLQDRLAAGRLHVLDACGHYPMYEAAPEFTAALRAFVAESVTAHDHVPSI